MRLIMLVAAMSALGGACEKRASDSGEVSVTRQPTPNQDLPKAEILRIARADAVKAYGDVSDMEVKAERKDDGWHVDYEPRAEHVNGGGPHYLIHPETGQIVKKEYQQ
jgi:hypothetical protein